MQCSSVDWQAATTACTVQWLTDFSDWVSDWLSRPSTPTPTPTRVSRVSQSCESCPTIPSPPHSQLTRVSHNWVSHNCSRQTVTSYNQKRKKEGLVSHWLRRKGFWAREDERGGVWQLRLQKVRTPLTYFPRSRLSFSGSDRWSETETESLRLQSESDWSELSNHWQNDC